MQNGTLAIQCSDPTRSPPHKPAPKRQKMSSVTSESTLAGETPDVTTSAQSSCFVASEDLASMMFSVADLQRVTNSWALHQPLTGAEAEMKALFKACEDIANSLCDTLESLELNAVNLASAQDSETAVGELHDSIKKNNREYIENFTYQRKCVYPLTIGRDRTLTVQ
jgi:hypothetical protein